MNSLFHDREEGSSDAHTEFVWREQEKTPFRCFLYVLFFFSPFLNFHARALLFPGKR